MSDQKKPKIMVVDDNVTNLSIARKALANDYTVVLIKDGAMALAEIANINPDLILLDVEMPGLSGFEVIEKLKNGLPEPYCNIPVIFLTAKDDGDSEYHGLNLGAIDYVIKPFSPILLKKRVELHLKLHNYSTNLENIVHEKTASIKELQYAIVLTLSEMVEKRDNTTGGHIVRTSQYLKVFLNHLIAQAAYPEQLNGIDVELYANASQMHDVGKISISDQLLLKEGKLTDAEFELMKKHTSFGSDIIKSAIHNVQDVAFLEIAEVFASSHHEKWNGAGYPLGLQGEEIPLGGRMMAIVDAYDAIISERPYKQAKTHEQAVEIIQKDSGSHFDPYLVDYFLAVADQFKQISQTCDYLESL